MKKNILYKGFTLIELLVVIAIIGVLASVVLGSLNSSRTKANDATVKSNMNNARSQADLFHNANNGVYVGTADVCVNGAVATGNVPGIYNMVSKAFGNGTVALAEGTAGAWNVATCYSGASFWVAEAPLKASASGSPSMYCVDWKGKGLVKTTVLAANATEC